MYKVYDCVINNEIKRVLVPGELNPLVISAIKQFKRVKYSSKLGTMRTIQAYITRNNKDIWILNLVSPYESRRLDEFARAVFKDIDTNLIKAENRVDISKEATKLTIGESNNKVVEGQDAANKSSSVLGDSVIEVNFSRDDHLWELLRPETDGVSDEGSITTIDEGSTTTTTDEVSNKSLDEGLIDEVASDIDSLISNSVGLSDTGSNTDDCSLVRPTLEQAIKQILMSSSDKHINVIKRSIEMMADNYNLSKSQKQSLVDGVLSKQRAYEEYYLVDSDSSCEVIDTQISSRQEDLYIARHINYYLRSLGLNSLNKKQFRSRVLMGEHPVFELGTYGDELVKKYVAIKQLPYKAFELLQTNESMKLCLIRMGYYEFYKCDAHYAGTFFEVLLASAYIQGNKDVYNKLIESLLGAHADNSKFAEGYFDNYFRG